MNKNEDIEEFTDQMMNLMMEHHKKLSTAVIGHQVISMACNALAYCVDNPFDAMEIITEAVTDGMKNGRKLRKKKETNE